MTRHSAWSVFLLVLPPYAYAEDSATEIAADSAKQQQTEERRADDASLNEDPEAQRRMQREAAQSEKTTSIELYASARVHAINSFDLISGEHSSSIADGNSRFGARADWEYTDGWYLIGRAELGFDVVDVFDSKTSTNGFGKLTDRLLYIGIDQDNLLLVAGHNWSTYYQIAGITDRFAIFGGSASGIYSSGTTGGETGLGRAEDVLQARIYVDALKGVFDLKPFNLNVQYQGSQPIPKVDGASYDYGFGVSVWLETETEYGIGIAYNRSRIDDPGNPVFIGSGISGDAEALAVSFRTFGDRWYASLLFSDLSNVETTDQGRYFNGKGVEVYAQWEVVNNWWLIGGGNALEPDEQDATVGEFRIRYAVFGLRYSFESFNKMLYTEYRIDDGRLTDGSRGKDEITIGVRWDFGA